MSLEISKNKPWYWICYGESEDSIAFNCKEATRSKIKAILIISKRNILESTGKWFIKELFEHPDRDLKQFKCPDCKNLMSQTELDKTWDWSGPHCNKCGCTGLQMFTSITEHAPVQSSRNVLNKDLKG